MTKLCGCTIASDAYRAHASVLEQSFRRHHPDADFVVISLDFGTHGIASLDAAELRRMATLYTSAELAGALKPHVIGHLLDAGAEVVVFLDADIEVFAPLDRGAALARTYGSVITPHMIGPRADFEPWFLRSGSYNAGFVAVSPDGRPFVDWWAARTARHGHFAPSDGYFHEQRWLDLAPAQFGTHVLRDPGYNVMGWNLHERPISDVDAPSVDGQPLAFFHFCSGFDPHRPELLATAPDLPWLPVADAPVVRELSTRYADRLLAAGYDELAQRESRLAPMIGDLRIDTPMRSAYQTALLSFESGGELEPPNPLLDAAAFLAWLLEPLDDEGVTRYLQAAWSQRADLRDAFPYVPGADSARYLRWVSDEPADRNTVPSAFMPSAVGRARTSQ